MFGDAEIHLVSREVFVHGDKARLPWRAFDVLRLLAQADGEVVPKEEILRVRLNRAKQLLTETDLPLSVIGEKIGLEHTEYISRIFKKKIGLTPGQFRKSAQATVAANRWRL